MNYKYWINNEYQNWITALQSCTVENFKENKVVQSMLGEVDPNLYIDILPSDLPWQLIFDIDQIGRMNNKFSGANLRFVYWALKILEQNPKSIVEIGGGVGQQYAILRALGYEGDYFIYDLQDVQLFQREYLKFVSSKTGLNLRIVTIIPDFCFSAYALGEFDDETKQSYIDNVAKDCPHGLIIWNPHSGASNEIPFECKVEEEYPLTAVGNKILSW